MTTMRHRAWLVCAFLFVMPALRGQEPASESRGSDVRLQIQWSPAGKHHAVPAVAWLEPLAGTPSVPFVSHEHYVLVQKNRMFAPHLLVVPVGSVVVFPNADPFFHNVFSKFDGKRFDLGLYEAGSSKSVTFSREGVSYIFCNIHPEMSAVVLTLSTPLYAVADAKEALVIDHVPPGDYKLHLWIEGLPPSTLEGFGRAVHISSHSVDLGRITVQSQLLGTEAHTNEYGKPYDPKSKSVY